MQWRARFRPPHTWIIMNHHILKSYHVYFHWCNVPNPRNENVTEVGLIVNMPFKLHNVHGHAYTDTKLTSIKLCSMNTHNTKVSNWFYMDCKILKYFVNFKSPWGCLWQKVININLVYRLKGKMFLIDILTSRVSGGLMHVMQCVYAWYMYRRYGD